MTNSSLIIDTKVTCCHFGIKQLQKEVKFGRVTNVGTENINLTFIVENDQFFINYSYKSDMLPLRYQTWPGKSEIWPGDKFWEGEFNYVVYFF